MDDLVGDKHDLTTPCLMHTFSPTMSLTFVPHKLVINWPQEEDTCWYCINEMEAEERGETDYENFVEECTCAPSDLGVEDWASYQYDIIHQTEILHSLIMNDNPAWLSHLRAQKMTVQATFGKQADPIMFRILYKDRFCEAQTDDNMSSHADSAWERLRTWGLFDLPRQDEMEFVVAFETETRSSRGAQTTLSRESREVCIRQSL
jgi:hypothetical protein